MKVASVRTRIQLGVFVLCVVVIAALCIILAGDEFSLFKSTKDFKAQFANTSGLVAGAPVRMGGVEIGRVSKMKIEPAGEKLVIAATLRIDSPYYDLIRRDATVALDTQGLLGDKFVDLKAGVSKEAKQPGETIETVDNDIIQNAIQKSAAIMDTVNSTAKKIDAFTQGLPDSQSMKTVGADFTESARALRILMTRISSDDSVVSALNDPEAKAMLKNSLASLESASAHADSIAKKIDAGEGTLGALVNDRSLFEDMKAIFGHIDREKIARRVYIEAGKDRPQQVDVSR